MTNSSSEAGTLTRTVNERHIDYLRISVTDRCNLACRYCVPKTSLPLLSHSAIARYEELLRLIKIATGFGITKVRITGGEPFVRKGLLGFIREIAMISQIQDVAVTTNGLLLKPFLKDLKSAGIKRLNISLDTLNPDQFFFLTGKNVFHKVWESILAAHREGIHPIKLNAVILRGINDSEIETLAGLTLSHPFHVRFIEYMPMGNSAVDNSQQVLIPEIRNRIEKRYGELHPIKREQHDGPANRFRMADAQGEIGFISPVSSHFCQECNRLRLTPTGKLRPCLLNRYEVDILGALRGGATDSELEDIFRTVIKQNPDSHSMINDNAFRIAAQMSSIGG